jgi:hypothetical protein
VAAVGTRDSRREQPGTRQVGEIVGRERRVSVVRAGPGGKVGMCQPGNALDQITLLSGQAETHGT